MIALKRVIPSGLTLYLLSEVPEYSANQAIKFRSPGAVNPILVSILDSTSDLKVQHISLTERTALSTLPFDAGS